MTPVIANYFQATNQGDVPGAAAAFAPEATVQDEGRSYQGREAIVRLEIA